MATFVIQPIVPCHGISTTTTPSMEFPKAAATAITKGQICTLASGLVVPDNTDPAAGAIIGVAAETITAAQAKTRVAVYPAYPGTIFEGTWVGTWAANVVGLKYEVTETNGIGHIDGSATTAMRVAVLRLKWPLEVAVGDINPRVLFVFLPNKTVFDVTTAD